MVIVAQYILSYASQFQIIFSFPSVSHFLCDFPTLLMLFLGCSLIFVFLVVCHVYKTYLNLLRVLIPANFHGIQVPIPCQSVSCPVVFKNFPPVFLPMLQRSRTQMQSRFAWTYKLEVLQGSGTF